MRFALWISILSLAARWVAAEPGQFLYLSDQRIVTVETADDSSIVLNYINLGDSFEILAAYNIVLLDDAGTVFRGHLFRLENPPDPTHIFEVTKLIRPAQFEGYVIAGKFDAKSPIARVLISVGGRILELEPMNARDFELMASRIGQIDLARKDRKSAIEAAGFMRGYGSLVFDGTAESAEFESFFPEVKVVPPVALATPQPRLPSSAQQLRDPVVVRVQATITKAGGLRDVHLLEGIEDKLDQIALQTVQNSWVFLPAISENELAEAELKLNVVFKR